MSSNEKMQLWIQDAGWRGCCIVIAMDEAAARAMMSKETWNYSANAPLRAYDLDAGFKHVNIGDQ